MEPDLVGLNNNVPPVETVSAAISHHVAWLKAFVRFLVTNQTA